MAVKVIGKPVDLKQVTCTGCGYRLEYRLSDARVHRPDEDLGDTDKYRYIVCPRPECGCRVKLDDGRNRDDSEWY